MDLILASTSSYRKALLERLGITFRCVAPEVDESAHQTGKPVEIAQRLARLKAEAVRNKFPASIVIGSDQVAAVDDEILNKPGNKERAFSQLKKLNGRSHSLFTAVTFLSPSLAFHHLDETRLQMRSLDDSALERYLDRDLPYDCAGSYKIECAGISLFRKIESEDFTAIQGLPLIAVMEILSKLGVSVL